MGNVLEIYIKLTLCCYGLYILLTPITVFSGPYGALEVLYMKNVLEINLSEFYVVINIADTTRLGRKASSFCVHILAICEKPLILVKCKNITYNR